MNHFPTQHLHPAPGLSSGKGCLAFPRLNRRHFIGATGAVLLAGLTRMVGAGEKSDPQTSLFSKENLVAWCIVPFDAKKRNSEERAQMLRRLGISQLAYDYRQEHIPTFDAEMEALKRYHIKLTAFWFPAALNEEARTILDVLKRHGIKTQLWVTMGDPAPSTSDPAVKVEAAVKIIRPIAEAAAAIGCQVALYNHGGWFGEPENQIAIIRALGMPNVGIVYNLHHGHEHIDRFTELLSLMKPYLLAINLNGMTREGDKKGMKILPLGQGDMDLFYIRALRQSGWTGPVGILNHTEEDAEARLKDNLDGLQWLVARDAGKPSGPKPTPISWQVPMPRSTDQ